MGNAKTLPFVPGTPVTPTFPLARYRSPEILGSLRDVLTTTTQPGDLVLELGSRGAACVQEVAESGRRMLALNVNPIPLLWTQIALNPAPCSEVQAALTRLGDLPKGERPFVAHVRDLYRSRCPHCHGPGSAEWFAWDRDTQRPFNKRVYCPHCETFREGPVDSQDLELLDRFPRRTGPAYHIALSRAAAPDDPLRARAAELVDLYTPRNLSVLMDIIHRLPQAASSTEVQRALTALVLEALDQGSSLIPYGEPLSRPRSLRPPQRFLENNVWGLLEKALRAYEHYVREATRAATPAPSLDALLGSTAGGYLLLSQPLGALARALTPKSIAAVIVQPQLPDAPFWALSALWASWLWKDVPYAVPHTFLGRRRLDLEWYRRNLAMALRRIRPLLKPGAAILVLLSSDDATLLANVAAALAEAGFHSRQWIACPPLGYRLVARAGSQQPALPLSTAEAAASALLAVLRQRGETTPSTLLYAAHLIASGSTAPQQLETLPQIIHGAAFIQPSPETVWLADPTESAKPLADRVEETVLRLLQTQETWERSALEAAVYTRFHEALSPEPALVEACIDAYTLAHSGGLLALRPEDQSPARRAEARQMHVMLRDLGARLGFEVTKAGGWDLVWNEKGKPLYLFHCTTTALVEPNLLALQSPIEGRRCLILPGGRAALLALKLRRDPRLHEITQRHRWTFIKFRHLRRMAAEIQHRSEIEVYLGLDPIVEQETAQIPLPLE